MQARAVMLHETGGPDRLLVETVDVPDPGPGEVRIRVEAFALNRSEALFREGWHPVRPVLPSRIGFELAGRVESVGDGVEGFSVGDAVGTLPAMEINQCGAYGELCTVPASMVVRNPPELDMAQAAALWSSSITAYAGLVDLVTIMPGDVVIVTAASSSVGVPAIQILEMLGARVIAVTRTRAKAAALAALGPVSVIVSDEEDLVTRVRELTGGVGAQFVFDPIGGSIVGELAEATAPYGTIILYGVMSMDPAPLPLAAMVQKNLVVRGFAMYVHDRPDRNARAIDFIRKGVAGGTLRPLVARTFPLDDIADAARYADSMQQIGKVVVTTTNQS